MAPFYDEGRYWVRVVSNQTTPAKSSGNLQFVLRFLVLGGVNPLDPGGPLLGIAKNFERTIYRSMTEKSMPYLLDELEELDAIPDRFHQLDERESDGLQLKGQEFEAYCKHEEDELTGQVKEKWSVSRQKKDYAKPDAKSFRALDNLFGKELKARAKTKAQESPKVAAPAGEAPEPPKRKSKTKTEAEPTEDALNNELNEVATGDDIPF